MRPSRGELQRPSYASVRPGLNEMMSQPKQDGPNPPDREVPSFIKLGTMRSLFAKALSPTKTI